ncbi:MAG: DUF4249 domain-containing protein [Bacteroidia bacterium]|jgi:hypothetical protein|nr:DUF4249 domain-containing protein [Bacteroidia bacterium]
MKKNNKNILLASIVFVLFSGCLNDTVRPDILQDYTPRLVVNAVVTSDVVMGIRVTSSKAILDSSYLGLITDAELTYRTSLGQEGSFTYDAFTEIYTSTDLLVPGEVIRVRGEHPDFPTILSEVRVPDSVATTASMVLNGGIDTSDLPGDLITLEFTDDPDQKNYYKIRVLYWNGFEFIPIIYPRSDPSFSEFNSLRLQDASILFTDDLFNGKEKAVFTVATNGLTFGLPAQQDKYKVEFASISSDFYDYFISLNRAVEAKEVSFQGGFNNAVVIHSNIDNGLGILATEWRSDFFLK